MVLLGNLELSINQSVSIRESSSSLRCSQLQWGFPWSIFDIATQDTRRCTRYRRKIVTVSATLDSSHGKRYLDKQNNPFAKNTHYRYRYRRLDCPVRRYHGAQRGKFSLGATAISKLGRNWAVLIFLEKRVFTGNLIFCPCQHRLNQISYAACLVGWGGTSEGKYR